MKIYQYVRQTLQKMSKIAYVKDFKVLNNENSAQNI